MLRKPTAIVWGPRNALPIATFALLANSIARGIRTPGRYSSTQLLINYDFGFCKRGLLSALVESLHIPYLHHYDFFFWFSVACFAINIVLFIELLCEDL